MGLAIAVVQQNYAAEQPGINETPVSILICEIVVMKASSLKFCRLTPDS